MKLKIGKRMGVRLEGNACCDTGKEIAAKPAISEITDSGKRYYTIDVGIEDSYAFTAKLNYCPECGERIEFIQVASVGR